MQPGVLLGSGREADVYAIDGERVLRRYRTGADTAAEADVMAYVAGHGFPVPRVYGAEGPDLVLERLDGPTMLRALASGEVETAAGAAILAGLHSRLHRIPARRSTESGATILHRDLHPENVMLTSHGPVVIDWRNAVEGPAAMDVALTGLIVAETAVDPASPLADAARAFLVAFLAEVGGAPLSQLDGAFARRRANPMLSAAEHERLTAAADLVRAGANSPD